MTLRSKLDALEKRMGMATLALAKQGRLAARFVVVNDPEDEAELAPYRLHGLNPGVTIEIGEADFEAVRNPR